ncbi:NADPH-dependent FMN reductase [Streptosporangium jomthongense]|uniref:NADPH-dependent FMN reductase n=1 Tax=Streptosporangium jomthongense TaxID=1193683 RepID=A0ABV8F5X5_9ACTN
MTQTPLHLALVVGSVREGRFGPTVASWFAEQVAQYGRFTTDVVDLAELPLPVVLPAFGSDPAPEVAAVAARLSGRLAAADAFVVVTPEYNHSLPASLKNALDWSDAEWRAKPVALVSYGGRSGGIRAAEHTRQILAALEAVTVREVLTFQFPREVFGEDGRPKDPEGYASTAKEVLRELEWLASTLREGRGRRPHAD